ncbi:hypothetical protein vBEcoMphAPEC6_gp366c [Escherichia phage vB_EcoM_phAPEC6]|nr:hypothetical protein vBEcoMphAPEC6_gp366c [Escherichia phage vB_EcoM_phAPEC6]
MLTPIILSSAYVIGIIISGMLAYNYNRSVLGYVVLGTVLSPVIAIGLLVMLGEKNTSFFITKELDKITPAPETVIPEVKEVEVQMQVKVYNTLEETDPKVVVNVVPVVEDVKPKAPKVQKNTKTAKKARYTKGKNKGKSKDEPKLDVHDHTAQIATAATAAAIVTSPIYNNDDYSDYSRHSSSSSDSCSYDSSSSDSSSSSGSCD